MNFGFNSNVRVGGDTYHVQTEDRGPSHPFLDTVVYLAGRVVYKRSTGYEQKFASGTEGQALAEKLHERLSVQHREVIAELEAETLPIQGKVHVPPTVEAAEASANEVDPHDGFDLRLLNPKNWFAAGNVIFEIELREKNSDERVGDADVQAFLEQERQRIPLMEVRTDTKGSATLKFPLPANVKEGSSLVVRATDGSRYGELRFRLKPKTVGKTPAPASR